jgi:O-methyltransferase/aklanonic acid methyltransferase
MTTPTPAEREAIAEVFDRSAGGYDSVIPFFQTFGGLLVEVAEVVAGERVLDVAAGRGASAFPAAERGAEVVAVDLSSAMVEALRADAASRGLGVTAEVADAHDLGYEDEFDVVLCGFTLHFVPAPERILEGFRRGLRSGGRCAISYPTGGGEGWGFYGDVLGRYAPRAQRPLSRPPDPGDLAGLVKQAGFERVAARDVTRAFTFASPEEWWRWVWTQGQRAPLEHFDADTLREIEAEMLDAVAAVGTPDGIPLHQTARFVTGVRP